METSSNSSTTMHARVLEANCCRLLVCDLQTDQEVVVHTSCGCRFKEGDCVCIHYSGAMTMSIPPQVSAHMICREES